MVFSSSIYNQKMRGGVQIRRKLRSLEGLLQFRGNEQHVSLSAHKLSIGAFALQTALDKVCLPAACWADALVQGCTQDGVFIIHLEKKSLGRIICGGMVVG